MPKAKTRKRINLEKLIAGVGSLPSTFTWRELSVAVGHLGSESQLRHILLEGWQWVEPTNETQPTEVLRKGKCVGGRPQKVYRKTATGQAGVLPVATVSV